MLFWTTIAVTLLLIAIIVHETAHALVIRRLGFPIVEAGIGAPFPPCLVLQPSRFIPFRLTLSPWLIGAYVTPDPERHEEIMTLPYRDLARYWGAGIIANFLFSGVLFVVIEMLAGQWAWATATIAGLVILWFLRHPITAYVLPALGVPALGVFVIGMVRSFGEPVGIVGLAQGMTVSTGYAALVLGCVLSFALGILNMIPIYPLDGGHIADLIITRCASSHIASWFRIATASVMGCILVYSIVSDIAWGLL